MNIGVVGAGISGLSTAYTLARHGHQVTVMAKDFYPSIVSNKAAAFWFPYNIRNDKRAIDWGIKSYTFFEEQSANEDTGISMIKIIKAVKVTSLDETNWLDFMPKKSVKELPTDQLPTNYLKGYEAIVPLIETQIFLPWLTAQVVKLGATIIEAEVNNFHLLLEKFDVVINCTALGARDLCNDKTVIPIRGQVVLLEPNVVDSIFIDNQSPTYIVPRKDATIIGGTYEENIFEANTVEETLNEILRKAIVISPELAGKKVIGNWAGLRPYRPEVRLEKEGNIIHNYGHGGSGYTLSFGCAEEVNKMVSESM